jgi:hypothetical protein
LVEQRTENPRVAGSIPALGIFYYIFYSLLVRKSLGIFYYIFLLTAGQKKPGHFLLYFLLTAGQKKPGHLFITFFRFFISLFILSSTNFRGIIF